MRCPFSQGVSRALHQLCHLLAHLRGVPHDMDASGLECGDLVSGTTLASCNNGTSVAHTTAWRCRLSSDEADRWQVAVVVGAEPLSGFLLSLATDLTNHDDTLGLGVINELGQHIDEVCAVEGVTTDSNNS